MKVFILNKYQRLDKIMRQRDVILKTANAYPSWFRINVVGAWSYLLSCSERPSKVNFPRRSDGRTKEETGKTESIRLGEVTSSFHLGYTFYCVT